MIAARAEEPHAPPRRRAALLATAARWAACAALAGCSLFESARPAPSPPPAPAATRDGRWQQDVAYLLAELPRQHPDAFFHTPRAEIQREGAELSARVPDLTDHEIVVGLIRLAALLGDEHTSVEWPGGSAAGSVAGFGCHPLRLGCFADGLFAITTTGHGREALRGRLVAIGGVSVDEAVTRAATLTARCNASLVRDRLPQLLTVPEIVHALGLSDTLDEAVYTFERPPPPPQDDPPSSGEPPPGADDDPPPNGEPPPDDEPLSPLIELPLAPMPVNAQYDWQHAPESLPICWQHQDRAYGLLPLPESDAILAQFNACREDPVQPFADFARELFAALDARSSAAAAASTPTVPPAAAPALAHSASARGPRLVLDLRWNGGGNSQVIEPLLDGLRDRPELRAQGALVVLIGRGTQSSGMLNALMLQRQFGALLVGEPTGGTPDGWGELSSFELPNSHLRVRHSTKRFALVPGADSLAPDVLVEPTSADWFAGHDAALAAALR